MFRAGGRWYPDDYFSHVLMMYAGLEIIVLFFVTTSDEWAGISFGIPGTIIAAVIPVALYILRTVVQYRKWRKWEIDDKAGKTKDHSVSLERK